MPLAAPSRDETGRSSQRNRRTAGWLLVWIALLMAASITVIWLKN